MNLLAKIILLLSTLCVTIPHRAATPNDSLIIQRIFAYSRAADSLAGKQDSIYMYSRFNYTVRKRNPLLLAVPSMFAIAHSKHRKYFSESLSLLRSEHYPIIDVQNIHSISTLPHKSNTLPQLIEYLVPRLYNVTLTEGRILSPFNYKNHRFYRYHIYHSEQNTAHLRFTPKVGNTQLLSGTAVVNATTGQIYSTIITGEWDLIRFRLNITMPATPPYTLFPQKILSTASFKLLGNKIECRSVSYFGISPPSAPDSSYNSHTYLALIRPDSLSSEEKSIYASFFSKEDKLSTDSVPPKSNKLKYILWDILGNHIFNKIRSRFGINHQGYLRINPIFNPLYLGYTPSKGLVYKQDIRFSYNFSTNNILAFRAKMGYSFKLHRFYYTIPLTWIFNQEKDGYLQFEISNGNRITNADIASTLKRTSPDSIDWNKFQLDYFKDHRIQLLFHYNINNQWGIQAGILRHNRTAIEKHLFQERGQQSIYRSFAPLIEVEFRPGGFSGPIFTCDYEHSFKHIFGSNMNYSRWEFDVQYLHRMSTLQTLSFRLGCGFYTSRKGDKHFLDYSNFRENNIPGGWNDEWSGEFELLNANWYNASDYYVRSNFTYESPLLCLSWLPFAGHFIESERLYLSMLTVNKLKPYIEFGYGFTTRLFSIGAFVSNANGKFENIGCKFGFELFRDW